MISVVAIVHVVTRQAESYKKPLLTVKFRYWELAWTPPIRTPQRAPAQKISPLSGILGGGRGLWRQSNGEAPRESWWPCHLVCGTFALGPSVTCTCTCTRTLHGDAPGCRRGVESTRVSVEGAKQTSCTSSPLTFIDAGRRAFARRYLLEQVRIRYTLAHHAPPLTFAWVRGSTLRAVFSAMMV